VRRELAPIERELDVHRPTLPEPMLRNSLTLKSTGSGAYADLHNYTHLCLLDHVRVLGERDHDDRTTFYTDHESKLR
jgi:hypothetical protein